MQLTIKELRGILARWDEPCNGCVEKDNFLMKINENRRVCTSATCMQNLDMSGDAMFL